VNLKYLDSITRQNDSFTAFESLVSYNNANGKSFLRV